MFTGIVDEIGAVRAVERHEGGARLAVDCRTAVEAAQVGDSISVNGCCVTVTTLPPGGGFTADLMGETLNRTALGALRPGDRVNLERPLRAGGRLGGHLVQGHVDGVARVLA
ncbi:MAG: riboflavin synthase, partial [Egibacteraceae bacterium]